MMKKTMAGIESGDRFYVIDDVSELRDVLEFYPVECINASSIAGMIAVVIDGPKLDSQSWDGCITLSFDNGISQCRLPLAALDMGRECVLQKDTSRSPPKRNSSSSSAMKDSPKGTFTNQRRNAVVVAQTYGGIVEEEEKTKEREIIYVRDTSSESNMVRNLAAESIQDAYRYDCSVILKSLHLTFVHFTLLRLTCICFS